MGLATGIAVVISLYFILVVLPVGVVIGCCGMWCLLNTSIQQEEGIYDVPSLNNFHPSDNQAYGCVHKSRDELDV